MDTLFDCIEELKSLEKLYIREQNLEISLISDFSFFDSVHDLHVIIGYESDHTFKNKTGKLVCGIVEIKKINEELLGRLVLPFSSKILFAKLGKNLKEVLIIFKDGKKISRQIIDMKEKMLDYQDFEYLLDDSLPLFYPLGEFNIITNTKVLR